MLAWGFCSLASPGKLCCQGNLFLRKELRDGLRRKLWDDFISLWEKVNRAGKLQILATARQRDGEEEERKPGHLPLRSASTCMVERRGLQRKREKVRRSREPMWRLLASIWRQEKAKLGQLCCAACGVLEHPWRRGCWKAKNTIALRGQLVLP